jgi:hypothetical protein
VLLRVTDPGIVCPTTTIATTTLRVVPPGYPLSAAKGEADELGYFSLGVCPKSANMSVGPVEAGVGIPLYSS